MTTRHTRRERAGADEHAAAYEEARAALLLGQMVHDRRTGLARVKAWLPDGLWVDVLTDLVYEGGRTLHLHRDLATIPVFYLKGAWGLRQGLTMEPRGDQYTLATGIRPAD